MKSMNKIEDEGLCHDQSCTSRAQCEGQTPSLAVASWLLSTINCLNYFGSCRGRGQELVSLVLWGLFLSFSSCLQFRMRKYLTELCIVEVDMGQKCVIVYCVSRSPPVQKQVSRNIPSQPSLFLSWLASSPGWQGHSCWQAVARLRNAWAYRPQSGREYCKEFILLLLFLLCRRAECHPCCKVMLLSDEK